METEEERKARWKKRIEDMKREKRRTELLHRGGMLAASVFAIVAGCCIGVGSAAFVHQDALEDGRSSGQLQEDISGNPGEMMMAEGSVPGSGQEGTASGGAANAAPGGRSGKPGGEAPDGGSGKPSGEAPDGGSGKPGGEAPDGGSGTPGGEAPDGGSGTPGGELAGYGEGYPEGGAAANGEEMWGEAVPVGATVPTDEIVSAGVPVFEAYTTVDTAGFNENIISEYGIFISVEDGVILAQKDGMARMNPASMTKILTVLVAAEHISEADLDDTVSITLDITDYCYIHGCSITGYDLGETVTVRDLFYGTVLPSGADSALALAAYVAGSHEAFVELMNEKLEELGLAGSSHFTNCVGLYDEEHYSTAYDIAVILKTAVNNEFCREVLSAHTYTTSQTEQHPEGLFVSNWFLRRIEDRDTHGEVLCGKTGYVTQSGNCAASFSIGNDGKEYLCVTAGSASVWTCIADQAELYQRFIPEQ